MSASTSTQDARAEPLVIVVDDDAMTRHLMHDLLPLDGYRVVTWGAGAGAAELIAREQPALVILDVRMETERAGIAVLRALRQRPDTAHIPVLVASACMPYLEPDERGEIGALRGEVMGKPFRLPDLLATIGQMLAA